MALRGKEETFVRRFAAGGNDRVSFDPRGYGDHSRRFAARGNEMVDRKDVFESCDGYHSRRFAVRGNKDHYIFYDSSPVFDEYEDEEWYLWFGFDQFAYDEILGLDQNSLSQELAEYVHIPCIEEYWEAPSVLSGNVTVDIRGDDATALINPTLFEALLGSKGQKDKGQKDKPIMKEGWLRISLLADKNACEDRVKINISNEDTVENQYGGIHAGYRNDKNLPILKYGLCSGLQGLDGNNNTVVFGLCRSCELNKNDQHEYYDKLKILRRLGDKNKAWDGGAVLFDVLKTQGRVFF